MTITIQIVLNHWKDIHCLIYSPILCKLIVSNLFSFQFILSRISSTKPKIGKNKDSIDIENEESFSGATDTENDDENYISGPNDIVIINMILHILIF